MAQARGDIGKLVREFEFNNRGLPTGGARRASGEQLGEFTRYEPETDLGTTVSQDIKDKYYEAVQDLNNSAIQLRYYGIDVTNPDPTNPSAVKASQAWHEKYANVERMAEDLKATREIEKERARLISQNKAPTSGLTGDNLTYKDIQNLQDVETALDTADKFTGEPPLFYTQDQVNDYNSKYEQTYSLLEKTALALEESGWTEDAADVRARMAAMQKAQLDQGAIEDDRTARQRAAGDDKEEYDFDWLREYTEGIMLLDPQYVRTLRNANRTYNGMVIMDAIPHPAQGGQKAYIQLIGKEKDGTEFTIGTIDADDHSAILGILTSTVPAGTQERKMLEGWMKTQEWESAGPQHRNKGQAQWDAEKYGGAMTTLYNFAKQNVNKAGKAGQQEFTAPWLNPRFKYYIRKGGQGNLNKYKLVAVDPRDPLIEEDLGWFVGKGGVDITQTNTAYSNFSDNIKRYILNDQFIYNPPSGGGGQPGSGNQQPPNGEENNNREGRSPIEELF